MSAPDVNRHTSAAIFALHRCTACELMFVIDPPGDLGPYYTFDYHHVPESAESLEPHLPSQRFKIELLCQFKKEGRLLEIGPSVGMFCRLAQRAGFDVSAIEMDEGCARFLSEHLGVRTVRSADPANVMADGDSTYDAICLWHTVEHVPAPWRVLEEAASHLNPGGVLILAAPNPLSPQAWLMGSRWPHHDLPRHLFALPIPWVLAFAKSHGLEPALVTTRDEGSLYWNRFSWGMRLRSLSNMPRLQSKLWTLGLKLGRLLQLWEGREGHGAAYTIVLRRPG